MANVIIPYLNPLKYQEIAPQNLPQYISKSMEKYPYAETIQEWETKIDYPHLFQTTDTVSQQISSDVGPLIMQLIDDSGYVKLTTSFAQKLRNKQNSSEWVYENQTSLAGLPTGYYFAKLIVGTSLPTIHVSEPIFICDNIPNSVYLEYKHRSFYGGVLFETGITFSIRVLGLVKLKSPASNDTIYEDQPLNETLIWSYPFELYTFFVGGSWGIPDYLIKRLNRIFGCSFTSIDGIQYTKSDGAKWEGREFENYPLRGWSIELRESLYKAAQSYQSGTLQTGRTTITASLDTDGFGAGGGGIIQISDVNG